MHWIYYGTSVYLVVGWYSEKSSAAMVSGVDDVNVIDDFSDSDKYDQVEEAGVAQRICLRFSGHLRLNWQQLTHLLYCQLRKNAGLIILKFSNDLFRIYFIV